MGLHSGYACPPIPYSISYCAHTLSNWCTGPAGTDPLASHSGSVEFRDKTLRTRNGSLFRTSAVTRSVPSFSNFSLTFFLYSVVLKPIMIFRLFAFRTFSAFIQPSLPSNVFLNCNKIFARLNIN